MNTGYRTPEDWHTWFTHQASWTRATRRWLYEQAGLVGARTVLEVGCGTGVIAGEVALRGPAVTGLDRDAGMLGVARREAGTVRLVQGDAHSLPFPDGSFDLVTLNNMIPFFGELARVTAPGGLVAVAYSRGAQTPIWVPLKRVRSELERRGFAHVGDFSIGAGLSLLARNDEVA